MTVREKLFLTNTSRIPQKWKMLFRIALVGAVSAILYYYVEKHLTKNIGA